MMGPPTGHEPASAGTAGACELKLMPAAQRPSPVRVPVDVAVSVEAEDAAGTKEGAASCSHARTLRSCKTDSDAPVAGEDAVLVPVAVEVGAEEAVLVPVAVPVDADDAEAVAVAVKERVDCRGRRMGEGIMAGLIQRTGGGSAAGRPSLWMTTSPSASPRGRSSRSRWRSPRG